MDLEALIQQQYDNSVNDFHVELAGYNKFKKDVQATLESVGITGKFVFTPKENYYSVNVKFSVKDVELSLVAQRKLNNSVNFIITGNDIKAWIIRKTSEQLFKQYKESF